MTVAAQLSPDWKCIVHAHMYRKDGIFRQKLLNHYSIGVGIRGRIIGPIMHHSFKEGRQLMTEKKNKKKNNYQKKMNLLLAHTSLHILLCGIFSSFLRPLPGGHRSS